MILLILIFAALCVLAWYCPMPKPLQIMTWVAAALVLLILILWLCGGLPEGAWYRRPVIHREPVLMIGWD